MTTVNKIRNKPGNPRSPRWPSDTHLVGAAMRYWPPRFGPKGSDAQLRAALRAEAEAMWPMVRERVLVAEHERVLRSLAASALPEDEKQQYIAEEIERFPDVEVEHQKWYLEHWVSDPTPELAARWADGGYRKIVTSHKFAAALMCTSLETIEAEDLELVGRTILFVVPDGMLSATSSIASSIHEKREIVADGRDLPYSRALLDVRSGSVLLYLFDGSHGCVIERTVSSVDDLVKTAEAVVDADPSEARVAQLACRLVLGLLLTMQHTTNFRTEGYPFKEHDHPRRSGPPPHRVVFVGKPMALDFRESVRSYVAGQRGAPPSVQTVVRGHYRRQVVGPNRAGRKVIWIEPYWRGPEDAPILARAIVAGPGSREDATGTDKEGTRQP